MNKTFVSITLILVLDLVINANSMAQYWDVTYGMDDSDRGHCVQNTADGGYVVGGVAHYFDAWVLKLDSKGDIAWQKTLGYSSGEVYAVQQTSEGGYVVAGYTLNWGAGGRDIWVLKFDGYGNVLWQKTYGGVNYDAAYSIRQTVDRGYILGGYTCSSGLMVPVMYGC